MSRVKPSIPYLSVVGSGRRAKIDPASQPSNNGLKPPTTLSRKERALWDAHIRPASWLTFADVLMASTFIKLWARDQEKPLSPAMMAHMRALGLALGQLGLPSRRRMEVPPPTAPDPGDEFFDPPRAG
jgi:hypothetical protein